MIINMKITHDDDYCTLNSGEVCQTLGISRATLYAYVSRKMVRAITHPNDARKSLYDRRDVQTLSTKQRSGRSRRAVAASTINWGEPVLTSKITRITDGQFFYRGKDAVEQSEHQTLEEVLQLLIGVPAKANIVIPSRFTPTSHPLPFYRILAMIAERAALRPKVDGRPAAGLLLRLTALAATAQPNDPDLPIHELLTRAWSKDKAASEAIRRALALCADHELNASTYAARVAASAGASVPASILAGLATLSGSLHGGLTDRCRSWMDQIDAISGAELVIDGEPPPGFGHPLYPDGDPRAVAILAGCNLPTVWTDIIKDVFAKTGTRPNLDFGLAFIERQFQLPRGAGLGIFAVGRTAGWIAHIFEQRDSGRLIRPRAAVSA
jgi:citrate synthase